jgi:Rhs element Vgr protein
MPAGGAAKHRFEFGMSEIYDFEIELDATRQYAGVEGVAWDVKHRQMAPARKARPVRLAQGNLDGDRVARAVGFPACRLSDPVDLPPDELQAWANARLARSRLAMIRGRIAVAGVGDVKLLDVIEIAGMGQRFNGRTQVTGLCHRLDEGGWRTDLQFGLPPDVFCRQDDVPDVPAAGLLPAVRGLQVGVVDKFEEDPDKLLRVRVTLPGIGDNAEAVWARLAAPDAGQGRGYYFRPETGDEVVVGFFNDDPRYPVILGALYGPKNSPPKDLPAPAEKNAHRAIVSRKGTTVGFVDDDKASVFIVTASKNKLLLDDGKEMVQLTDQHGNTVTMDKSGIILKSQGDVKIEAAGNVEIKGAKVDVK